MMVVAARRADSMRWRLRSRDWGSLRSTGAVLIWVWRVVATVLRRLRASGSRKAAARRMKVALAAAMVAMRWAKGPMEMKRVSASTEVLKVLAREMREWSPEEMAARRSLCWAGAGLKRGDMSGSVRYLDGVPRGFC